MILFTEKHKTPFQIDDDDFEIVRHYSWCINNSGYALTSVGLYGNSRRVLLHILLLGKAPDDLEWDHKNRNKLDNRRANLRVVTRDTNMRNKSIRSNNTSGVLGVLWVKSKWVVSIGFNNRRIHVGQYKSFEEAVQARKQAELDYWGTDASA